LSVVQFFKEAQRSQLCFHFHIICVNSYFKLGLIHEPKLLYLFTHFKYRTNKRKNTFHENGSETILVQFTVSPSIALRFCLRFFSELPDFPKWLLFQQISPRESVVYFVCCQGYLSCQFIFAVTVIKIPVDMCKS
jgi:hypothetical protein